MRALLAVALLVVAMALALAPSPYYLMMPGGAFEIEPRLEVPEEHRKEMGRLAFTAVLVQPGTWAQVVRAGLDPAAEVIPAEEVVPPGVSREELDEIQRRLMEESKLVATVVALQAAGYEAAITGQGAEVVRVLEGMPAAEALREGDVIVAVDGQAVETATDVIEAVRRHQVGETVQLTVLRDGEQLQVAVGTRSSVEEPGRPVVGAAITTRLFDVDLPFPVRIETEAVGGPSGGVMLAIAILDAVTDGVLTRGYAVAGTGTIAPDGSVGPIGGAAEKVLAAKQDGYDVFLVPTQNYDEARRTASGIRLEAVSTLQEAVRTLCSLEPRPRYAEQAPEPCATFAA